MFAEPATWRVAVAIVSLSLALYIVSGGRIRGMPYSIYPFVRFWGLVIGVFGWGCSPRRSMAAE